MTHLRTRLRRAMSVVVDHSPLRWPLSQRVTSHAGRLARLYGLVGLALLLSLAVFAAGLWGFVRIAESVLEGETAQFDEGVLRWLDAHATPTLDRMAIEITALGSGTVVVVIVLALSALLWQVRQRYLVYLLWLTVSGSVVLNAILKLSFDRPRPRVFEWRVHYPVSSSFPSGHAMTAAVVYLTVAIIILRVNGARKLGIIALLCAAILMLLVGLSRMYVGVHYPSDVVAGYAAGVAWTGLCTAAIGVLRARAERTIATAVQDK
ncbi:MAG: phosphatase PAP2 family protein [Longimicrobiales bacterium]